MAFVILLRHIADFHFHVDHRDNEPYIDPSCFHFHVLQILGENMLGQGGFEEFQPPTTAVHWGPFKWQLVRVLDDLKKMAKECLNWSRSQLKDNDFDAKKFRHCHFPWLLGIARMATVARVCRPCCNATSPSSRKWRRLRPLTHSKLIPSKLSLPSRLANAVSKRTFWPWNPQWWSCSYAKDIVYLHP